jgi:transposase
MRAYSIDLGERIVAAIDTGRPTGEVARLFRVSVATVHRYRTLRRAVGSLAAGRSPGRPRALAPADEPALAAQVVADPDATLADHCRRWETEHGVRLSVATMGRTLRRLGWTRKKAGGSE